MSDNMSVLEALMAASKRKDHQGFLDVLTEDIEYVWKLGARPIRGKATMLKFLKNYEAGFDQKAWTISRWAEKDEVIFVEGVETLYDRARDLVIDNPFMQVVEFRDGRICKVRDYYDSALVSAPERPKAQEGVGA